MSHDPALVAAWGAVAPGYLDYWVPRFRPWLADAVDALLARALPSGPLAVPGCGPGEEVLLLRARRPEREVVALDPAPGMLDLLRARLAGAACCAATPDRPGVRVVQADADALPDHVRDAAGVLSCFTLQLLERPLDALAAWGRALAPGAPLVVLFWPRQPDDTPWGRLRVASQAEGGPWRPEWEPDVRARLGEAGLVLDEARDLVHAMPHASPEEAWDRLVDSGSLQGLARRVGPEVLARLRARWLGAHALTPRDGAWTHAPVGRLWCLRRA